MNGESLLREKLGTVLDRERVKRREKILVSAFFCSLLGSLVLLPAQALLFPWAKPLFVAPVIFLALVLGILLLRPWSGRDALRAVFRLDRALKLEERAITAWEILGRKERRAAELLVLEEAQARLNPEDPKALLEKRYSWHYYLAPPLFFIWLLFVWFDVGPQWGFGPRVSRWSSLSQRLKDFAQEMREQARREELTETLKMATALDEAAQKSLRGEISEKRLREEVAQMAQRSEDPGAAASEGPALSFPGVTKQALSELRAEAEALQQLLSIPDSGARGEGMRPDIADRVNTLPRLSAEITKHLSPGEGLAEQELSRLLDRLKTSVTEELDRRAVQEIREFLAQLMMGTEGSEVHVATTEEQRDLESLSEAERNKRKANLPGDEPGTREPGPNTPLLQADAAAHLRGLLGEGQSRSLSFRGEPGPGQSEIGPREVLTAYRRQAESALASEEIPAALKETIKSYFLSIGITEERGGN